MPPDIPDAQYPGAAIQCCNQPYHSLEVFMMRIINHFIAPALILSAVALSGCEGKPLIIEQKCGSCHESSVVYKHKRPLVEWDRLVFGMKARGMKVTPEEEKEIMDILAKRYSRK
jgi:hypothetical protein